MVTDFVAVLMQPPEVVTVYVITAVPAATPVTIPEDAPIVATEVDPLIQEPPEVVLVHVCEEPTHIGVVPVMVWAT